MRADPNAAGALWELAYADHLIVWSFRAFAVGKWRCAVIEREYRDACGAAAPQAMNSLTVFGLELAVQGRRTIAFARPGLLSLTRDEQLLLALYAAAQAGDRARFDAHLSWLLGRPAVPPFYHAAQVTARALAARGYELGRSRKELDRTSVLSPPPGGWGAHDAAASPAAR